MRTLKPILSFFNLTQSCLNRFILSCFMEKQYDCDMTQPSNKKELLELINQIEEEELKNKSQKALEPRTVLDEQGNLVKLGETVNGIEIVYGASIPLNLEALADGHAIDNDSTSNDS